MITLLSSTPSLALRQVEEEVRKVLAALPEGATQSTTELVNLVAGDTQSELRTRVFEMVRKLPSTLYSTQTEIADRGWAKGKEVKRKLWHALPSATMPERPATPSQGAASKGISLLDLDRRISALESVLLTKGTENGLYHHATRG